MSSFNANFYTVTAAIIPVLYLALTLQGRTFEALMARWRSFNQEAPFKFLPQLGVAALALAAMAGAAAVFFGVLAEFLSLRALYTERSTPATQAVVLDASIILLAMTAAGPFFWFWSAYFGTLADDYRAARKGMRRRAEEKKASPPKDSDSATSSIDVPHPEPKQPESEQRQSEHEQPGL
jgi:hypothetical protein